MRTSKEEKTRRRYFQWLCSIVGVEFDGFEFNFLLKKLFDKEFYWTVANDDNRATDGVWLRANWLFNINEEMVEVGQIPIEGSDLEGPCSVFEMMIGLSWRMEEDVMMNEKYGNRTAVWFWNMLWNMFADFGGVEVVADDMFMADPGTDIFVDHVVQRMLDRKYDYDGSRGALFILKRPRMDMTQVEIWSQAMSWLSENYLDEE